MIFFEYFKKYLNKKIKVTLKNDLCLIGFLKNIDHFLNMQLDQTEPKEDTPGLGKSFVCSVRGSSVKYVDLERNEILENRVTEATYLRFGLDKN